MRFTQADILILHAFWVPKLVPVTIETYSGIWTVEEIGYLLHIMSSEGDKLFEYQNSIYYAIITSSSTASVV
jgi:hypothetical protein